MSKLTPAQEAAYARNYGGSREGLSSEAQAEYDQLKEVAVSSSRAAAYTPPPKYPEETAAERYARQSRNAVVFIAVVIAVGLVVSLIIGIVAVAALHGLSPVQPGGGL